MSFFTANTLVKAVSISFGSRVPTTCRLTASRRLSRAASAISTRLNNASYGQSPEELLRILLAIAGRARAGTTQVIVWSSWKCSKLSYILCRISKDRAVCPLTYRLVKNEPGQV